MFTSLIYSLTIIKDLENRLLDYRFSNWNEDVQPDSNIVLISIDDGSLDYFNQNGISWPWPRSFYAHLLDYFSIVGAKTVIFDMSFSHPDADRSYTDSEETDGLFASALQRKNGSILSMIINGTEFDVPYSDKVYDREVFLKQKYVLADSLIELPLTSLRHASTIIGHTNIGPDHDGIYRHVKPVIKVQDNAVPCLALAAYMESFQSHQIYLHKSKIEIDQNVMPLDKNGNYLINWYGKGGPGGVFKYYPFAAVIQSASAMQSGDQPTLAHEVFKDKMIIIGADAAGMRDLKATPISHSGIHPGMEIWATILSNLSQKNYVHPFNGALLQIILFGMGFLILYAFDQYKPRHAYGIFLSIILTYFFLAFVVWRGPSRTMLPVSPGIIIGLLAYLTVFSNEMRERIFLKRVFGAYVAPELMHHMRQTGKSPSLGGAQILGTAFFSDIQGFTKFSEKLTPTKLVALLNEYLTSMTEEIMNHNGTLDKYVGDAIVAFYGAPVMFPEHALFAVKTAISMQNKLSALRLKWENEGDEWPREIKDLQMRIGINTGDMLVGNVGSRGRMNYTMIGDTVNTASRLESSAKDHGVLIQISESTAKHLPKDIILRELGATRLLGKSEASISYEVFGMDKDLSEEDIELLKIWPLALQSIQEQEWEQAEELFNLTLALERNYDGRPTNPSKVYLETRIPFWRENQISESRKTVWVYETK